MRNPIGRHEEQLLYFCYCLAHTAAYITKSIFASELFFSEMLQFVDSAVSNKLHLQEKVLNFFDKADKETMEKRLKDFTS